MMQEKSFALYEYTEVTVKQSIASMCADGYENFGWALENTAHPAERPNCMTLKFKRDRRRRGNTELARLQRQFDACLNDVCKLEASKTNGAMVVSMAVAIVGTALMAGAGFAIVGGMVPLAVILAIPALVGWALPYLLYKRILRQKAEQVTPLIDQKYDEIYSVCERASTLVG